MSYKRDWSKYSKEMHNKIAFKLWNKIVFHHMDITQLNFNNVKFFYGEIISPPPKKKGLRETFSMPPGHENKTLSVDLIRKYFFSVWVQCYPGWDNPFWWQWCNPECRVHLKLGNLGQILELSGLRMTI